MLPRTLFRTIFLLAVGFIALSDARCSSKSEDTREVEEASKQDPEKITKGTVSPNKYDAKVIALRWLRAVQESDFNTIIAMTDRMQNDIRQIKLDSPQPFWKKKIDEYVRVEKERYDNFHQWISFRRYVPKSSRMQVIDTRKEKGMSIHTVYVKVDYQVVDEAPVARNIAPGAYPNYILQGAVLELGVTEPETAEDETATVTYDYLRQMGPRDFFRTPPRLNVDGMVYWPGFPLRIGRVVAYTDKFPKEGLPKNVNRDWGKGPLPANEYPGWLRVEVVGGQGDIATFTGRIVCDSSTSDYPRGSFITYIYLVAPPHGARGITHRLDRGKTFYPVACTIDVEDGVGQKTSAIVTIPIQPPGGAEPLCWEHPSKASGRCPLF